jgi:hypothetical protein
MLAKTTEEGVGTNMALTDTWLRAARGAEKPYKKSDSGGLFIQVMPDGKRYWRVICGTTRLARGFFRRSITRERCGHMFGLSARFWTAGLDEFRDASG